MADKDKQKNEIIPIADKKDIVRIDDVEYDIPIPSLPYLTEENKDFIMVLSAKMRGVGNGNQKIYIGKVNCPRLVYHLVEHDLSRKLFFKFVKDSSLGSIMIYVYDNGVYRLVSEDEFKGYIKDYIPEQIRKVQDITEIYNLLLMEKSLYIENTKLNSDYRYICFKNGNLNLDTMEIEEHTPEKFFTVQIPVDYVPLKDCVYGYRFEHYLDELCSGDEVTKKVILECMGLALSNIPGYLTKKCILMIGPKDCGKTQIKKLLTELIGIEYTSSMDLDKMNDSRFGTSELYNKRLAGSNDMRYTAINDMGIFKQLTGGDPISIEFKGRGAFSYIYKGFIWFLANDFPMFSGKKGKEIYERFLVIPCKHVVEKNKQDPELVEKMLLEKEYIVSLCIENLIDLRKRNYRFVTSKEMDEAMNDYEVINNSLLQFVHEYCDIDDDINVKDRITLKTFKRNYQMWCRDSNIKPMKINKQEVEYYLKPKYKTEIVKSSNNYITNLKMKDSFQEDYGSFSSN